MSDLALIKDLHKIINEFDLSPLKMRLKGIEQTIEDSNHIDVAVFGRFKAGKSSFINHLIGKEILPIGVIPVTSVITKLKFTAQEDARIRFADGTAKQISFAEISEYISASKNPENIKGVESAEIGMPLLKSFEGLQFVDTPGFGSVFKQNNETSLQWLPNVGMALVAVSVDPPLSQQDLSLIEEIHRFTPKVAVLLTKCDLVSAAQLGEIQKFIQHEIKKHMGFEIRIWPYSINAQFINFKEELLSGLFIPLSQERGIERAKILRYKLDSIRLETIGLLSIALKASRSTDQDRARLRECISAEKIKLNSVRDELQILSREYIARTRPFIMAELTKYQQGLVERVSVEFRSEILSWKGSLWQLSRLFENWLSQLFEREFSSLSVDLMGPFLKPLNDAHEALTRTVLAFQATLATAVKNSFGVDLKTAEFAPDIPIPSQPEIAFSRLFDSHLDLLSFAIPMVIFRKTIERHFLKSIPYEVEKNLSRLASQWTEAINETIQRMSFAAQAFILSQILQLEQLLESSASATEALQAAIGSLQSHVL